MATSTLSTAAKDFFGVYLPANADIPPANIAEKRTEAAAWFTAAHPTVNNAPGTVFGDLFVSTSATDHAAFEVALERIAGDMDLANIRSGGAFNCDFASAFVSNFESEGGSTTPARGLIRLVFSADADVVLPGDIQFQIRSVTFTPDLAYDTAISIRKVGSSITPGTNEFALKQLSPTRYVAVIPLHGDSGTVVTTDDAVTVLRYTITGLVETAVERDFSTGASTRTLSQRAQAAQQTYSTSSGNTRAGVTATLSRLFPEISLISTVMPWDRDSLRDGAVLFAGTASVDVFVKSNSYASQETQVITFVKGAGNYLVAELITKHPILYLEQFVATDTTTWVAGDPSCDTYIQSTSDNAPLATCAGTEYQRVFAVLSLGGIDDLVSDTVVGDVPGYSITVTYRTEPMLRYISDFLNSDTNRQIGVDVLVRPFIPIVLSTFAIQYRARTGIRVNGDQALSETYTYLTGCGGPDSFSFARICEIMTYAQALDVGGVETNASARFSAGTYVLPKGAANPVSDYATMLTERIAIPTWEAFNGQSLSPTQPFRDPFYGTATETKVSLNRENVTFVVDANQISLTPL